MVIVEKVNDVRSFKYVPVTNGIHILPNPNQNHQQQYSFLTSVSANYLNEFTLCKFNELFKPQESMVTNTFLS